MGKQVPQELLRQIAIDKQKELEQDSFNNFNRNSEEEQPAPPAPPTQEQIYRAQLQQQQMRQQQMRQQPPPNKYSPQYAAYIGAKPRAQASARVGMGPRR